MVRLFINEVNTHDKAKRNIYESIILTYFYAVSSGVVLHKLLTILTLLIS